MIEGKKSYTSHHYPYLPVTFSINKQVRTVEALIDTGFEGDLVIPEGLIRHENPDSYIRYTLADPEATVLAPSYLGRAEVAHMGDYGLYMAIISCLGTEPIIGRNLLRKFKVILDHGERVTIKSTR